ncbi:MAG: efflux RND transporter permease subunit [Terriglobia bacterium]
MWPVRLALRRPYTMAVLALLIMLLGILSATETLVDIFPSINIPVVMVVWNYPGLSALDMERRVIIIAERAYSTTVNGIERIESDSIPGIGLMKIYFQPGTSVAGGIAQISSISDSILRIFPPGMQAPAVIDFNAGNVPVVQMTLSSPTLTEQQIFDYGLNFIRVQLFTIPGLSVPAPFGGKFRQIMVNLNPQEMAAKGLSPADIVTALQRSNVVVPAGNARMGTTDYNVLLNSSPDLVSEFNQLPVKVVNHAEVLLGNVAHVVDSYAQQENVVHVNGRRAAYLAILKHADSSTITVVDSVRKALHTIRAVAPKGLNIGLDFDQSVFVRAAVQGVLREAVITSFLISLLILVFLGSWRSMVIVSTSIPLSILTGVIILHLTGNTLNLMTLGGLALAIGMLVDDATVAIENIHRNLTEGKPLTVAILDGQQQVAVPAIVATLSICIVFFPVTLLSGTAKFLFTPLALAVVASMLASYVLSRTLVTTMARYLLAGEKHGADSAEAGGGPAKRGVIKRFTAMVQRLRDQGFVRFQGAYGQVLEVVLARRAAALVIGVLLLAITALLTPAVGTDLFPSADAGLMRLHFRAPAGTRIEDTERLTLEVEDRIRQVIPANELNQITDMIGVPVYYDLAFVQTDNVGEMDADIRVSLKPHHHPTVQYQRELRRELPREFPGCGFYFEAADIVNQVLNFGLSSPIDVQVTGSNYTQSVSYAQRLLAGIQQVPGAVDVRIKQVLNYPALMVHVDRQRAAQFGVSMSGVADSMLVALSSSSLVAPSFYLNPANSVNYIVAVQVPFEKIHSVGDLLATPLTNPDVGGALNPSPAATDPAAVPEWPTQRLSSIARIYPVGVPEEISHYTVQRVIDVDANVDGRDLGGVSHDILSKIAALGQLPAGMAIRVRGQYEVMQSSFRSLGLGLILAIVLVYFLMVVLYQSWLDPFIIMMAVPAALVGIIWMLAITHTTINVESMMGSIMAVGIATSNSILLVSFANDLRVEKGLSPVEAALEAGKTRLRPVLMTALAMIIGMVPMAMAMGEAGEQNAPLGRAVIGGLIVATGATLFLVPVIYSLLRRSLPTKHLLDERFRAEEQGERTRRSMYDEFGG